MKPGEQFELFCYEYLQNTYKNKETHFYHEGGMDSTKSDIAVIKNGQIDFYIEAKDALAQSGQFVLFPDEDKKVFIFSRRNRSKPNEMTDIIIEYMNSNFCRFNNAGTAGKSLDIDTDVFADWIIEYYKSKNVKYVISYDSDFVIFLIRKFEQYFNIVASYRIKKSGSCEPAKKDISIVKHMVKSHYSTSSFYEEGKKLFVDISEKITNDKFVLGDYTYYLSERNFGKYEVRRLSNTYNMNVIFSIKLIKSQEKMTWWNLKLNFKSTTHHKN